MHGPTAELLVAPEGANLEALAITDDSADDTPGDAAADDSAIGLQLVELELALDSLQAERNGFSEAIGAAMRSLGGDFLFSLPAAGLADGFQKIAVVRLPGGDAPALAFVLLSEDGTRISVRQPDDDTMRLTKFSNAFVDLLERF
ncbi:MAG TPA: hypothetical protein VFJ18_11785 [Pararhizobium sp.]|jgi:hypothetical protein|nr:hypothetical protein [Pararhizobium sp.]